MKVTTAIKVGVWDDDWPNVVSPDWTVINDGHMD